MYKTKIENLRNNTILSLKKSKLEEHDMKYVAEALRLSQITKLDLSSNNIGCNGLKYLADVLKDTQIVDLNLRKNQLRIADVQYLAEILSNTKIRILNLAENKIGLDDEFEFIAGGLKHSNITELDLSHNDIGCNSLKHLTDSLKHTRIVNLYLNNNNLRIEGLNYLVDNLKNSKIKKLDLEGNKIGLENDLKYFFEALKCTQITELNLSCNNIRDNHLKYLAGILEHTKINSLNLSNDDLRDESVKCLAEVLSNTKIENLNLTKNQIGFEAAEYLNRFIKDINVKNLSLDICYITENKVMYVHQRSEFDGVSITLQNNDVGIAGSKYINNSFCTSGIKEVKFSCGHCNRQQADNLFQAFKNIKISKLYIRYFFYVEKLIRIVEGSQIGQVIYYLSRRSSNADFLAEFVKKIKIFDLNISSHRLRTESIRLLAPAIKINNIMKLNLERCNISSEKIKYLSEVLRYTKIVSMNLSKCKIGIDGAKHLANGLPNSQVTSIDLHGNIIEYAGYKALIDIVDETNLTWVYLEPNYIKPEKKSNKCQWIQVPRNTIPMASKIISTFQMLVSFNSTGKEFEFIVPEENYDPPIDIYQYVSLIAALKNNPNSKAHIMYDMCVINDICDLVLIEKMEDFITNMANKFNSFFNDNLSCSSIFANADYLTLVKYLVKFEMSDIIQNLLLHRALFYVDENQEILHPYIYKLLNQYNLPLYNSELEPEKKDKIISYFKNRQEMDDAKEIVHLLKSKFV